MAQYGLVAWTYRLTSGDVLAIDWEATRNLDARIAAAYREPLGETGSGIRLLRNKAARLLAQAASGDCGFRGEFDAAAKH